ncbi:MAG: IS66 family transposase, partial [Thermoplasmata archaeon]
LPPTVAPPRSRFDWGSHFLVGYWSLQGLTTSGLQDLLATNYGLSVSAGAIDAMLRRSAELFAPAYAAIRDAVRRGQSVHVDWTWWRVDGINHHLWDFLGPEAKAAFFTVARSAGHTVPERVLGKRRKDRVLECDGATAFNALSGRKQRCWVHILRHARRGLEWGESVSDAPDWRGLRVLEKISRGVLAAARLPTGEAKCAEAERLRGHLARWLEVERDGEAAQSLQKFLAKHEGELWWWADLGVAAHNNLAEQGLRPHIAKKRKLSWGSRTMGGAERFATLASVVQTGKMHGIGLRELGERVLGGHGDPFGFGAGPPNRN